MYIFLILETLVQLMFKIFSPSEQEEETINRQGIAFLLGTPMLLMLFNNIGWFYRPVLIKWNKDSDQENIGFCRICFWKCINSHVFEYVHFFIAWFLLGISLPTYYLPILSPHKFLLWCSSIVLLQTMFITLPFATLGKP